MDVLLFRNDDETTKTTKKTTWLACLIRIGKEFRSSVLIFFKADGLVVGVWVLKVSVR